MVSRAIFSHNCSSLSIASTREKYACLELRAQESSWKWRPWMKITRSTVGRDQDVFLLINHHCKSLHATWIIWLEVVMVWIWHVSHRLIRWGQLVHSWGHCLGSRGITGGGRSLGHFALGPPCFLPLPGCFRWTASTKHACCHDKFCFTTEQNRRSSQAQP